MNIVTLTRFGKSLVLGGLLLQTLLSPAAHAQNLLADYNRLKALENNIPLPLGSVTLDVGTFDAATGNWDGPEWLDLYDPGPPPIRRTMDQCIPRLYASGINVHLRFFVRHGSGTIRVTAGGHSASAPASAGAVTVNIGQSSDFHWSLTCNGRGFSDRLRISRPPIISAGVAVIPVLPTAVIYEPPQFGGGRNFVQYTTASQVGTTTATSFTRSNSSTVPGPVSGLTTFQGAVTAAASVAPPLVSAALNAFAAGLGSVRTNITTGQQFTQDQRFSVDVLQSSMLSTGEQLGPGQGDRIVYLRNVRIAWLWNNGSMRLTVLGYDSQAADSVVYLQQLRRSLVQFGTPAGYGGLKIKDIDTLLALDPFVAGGPNAALSSTRYDYLGRFSGSGAGLNGDVYTLARTLTTEDTTTAMSYRTETTEFRTGFLSFLGLGVTQDQTLVTTLSQTSSQTAWTGRTVQSSLTMFTPRINGVPTRYAIDVYYDRHYGTFAVKTAP